MKIVRSWPRNPPPWHPLIEDDCERVYIPGIDYSPLLDLDDDLIHLDWDVAVGRNELKRFADKCKAEPEIVRTAPYTTYKSRQYLNHPWRGGKDQFTVWHYSLGGQKVELLQGELNCNLTGFGLIYLPKLAFAGYMADKPDGEPAMDTPFCLWYLENTGRDIPVEWWVNAVHVNYSFKGILEEIG
jgi:hypothetical protein